jgi:tight adherence protein B
VIALVIGLIAGLGFILLISSVVPKSSVPVIEFRPNRPLVPAQVWPDVVDDMSSAIKAGLSLGQTLDEVASRGPLQVRPLFRAAYESYMQSGDLAIALTHIRLNARDAVADKFCSALVIAHQVGGSDLGSVLRSLSEVLREDLRIRGELKARQAWTVNGARLALAAPWLTVALLSLRSEAASVYASALGIRVLTMNAVLSGLAYLIMMRISRLPHDETGIS